MVVGYRRVFLTALALALTVTLALAVGAAGEATGTSAIGAGFATDGVVVEHFAVAAQAFDAHGFGPQRAYNAIGHVVEDVTSADPSADFRVEGDVGCLHLFELGPGGPTAEIGLTITKGSGAAAAHVGEAFYVFLFAGGGVGGFPSSRFGDSGFTGGTTLECVSVNGVPQAFVTRGNITVTQ